MKKDFFKNNITPDFRSLTLSALLAISALVYPYRAKASDETVIIDVRRNIPLADTEPVLKDFIIHNLGLTLKRGSIVSVYRKSTVRDFTGANSYGELEIPVGQLKIIAVSGKIAVGREFKIIDHDNDPLLEQIGIMIGDRITLEKIIAAE